MDLTWLGDIMVDEHSLLIWLPLQKLKMGVAYGYDS
jgi:hypothetical protein